MAFSLEVDWIEARLSKCCELTGLLFDFDGGGDTAGHGPYSPSLDRIDSSKGYTPENTRVVCFGINALLGKWGDVPAEILARAYVERLELKRGS